MTPNDIESLLRETLQAHEHDVADPGPDPWRRVSQAHRRSRARRRTATLGALVAIAALGGSLVSTQPWQSLSRNSVPADKNKKGDVVPTEGWHQLDDGQPRGALGRDPQLRQDVLAVLQNPDRGPAPTGNRLARTDSLHVLWADVRGGRRLALVRAAITGQGDSQIWVGQPAPGQPMTEFASDTEGPALGILQYRDAQGGQHLLGVVRRDATVTGTRTVIGTDGRIRRDSQAIAVQDGVIDVPLGDVLSRGPLMLQARSGEGGPAQTSTLELSAEGLGQTVGSFITAKERAAALRGARGPGIALKIQEGMDVRNGGIDQSVNALIREFDSDAAHTSPKVEWAGEIPAGRGGGALHAVSAGLPGQGRLLEIERFKGFGYHGFRDWRYQVAVPAGRLPDALVWRVHTPFGVTKPTGQVVGWLFGPSLTSVDVTVDGKPQKVTTQDGLGWVTVPATAEVTVTAHGLPGGTVTRTLQPRDVQPNYPPMTTLIHAPAGK